MQVLDVGCGVGDSTFVLRELVGEDGRVIGIDKDLASIAVARRRAEEKGWLNVLFVSGDVEELCLSAAFDVIAGRFILAYVVDKEGVLNSLVPLLERGGCLAFQEWEYSVEPPSFPKNPDFAHFNQCILKILQEAGIAKSAVESLSSALKHLASRERLELSLATLVTRDVEGLMGYLMDTAESLRNLMDQSTEEVCLSVLSGDLARQIVRSAKRNQSVLGLCPILSAVWWPSDK